MSNEVVINLTTHSFFDPDDDDMVGIDDDLTSDELAEELVSKIYIGNEEFGDITIDGNSRPSGSFSDRTDLVRELAYLIEEARDDNSAFSFSIQLSDN
jgi:hypothetical protein